MSQIIVADEKSSPDLPPSSSNSSDKSSMKVAGENKQVTRLRSAFDKACEEVSSRGHFEATAGATSAVGIPVLIGVGVGIALTVCPFTWPAGVLVLAKTLLVATGGTVVLVPAILTAGVFVKTFVQELIDFTPPEQIESASPQQIENAKKETLKNAIKYIRENGISTQGVFRLTGVSTEKLNAWNSIQRGSAVTEFNGVHHAVDVVKLMTGISVYKEWDKAALSGDQYLRHAINWDGFKTWSDLCQLFYIDLDDSEGLKVKISNPEFKAILPFIVGVDPRFSDFNKKMENLSDPEFMKENESYLEQVLVPEFKELVNNPEFKESLIRGVNCYLKDNFAAAEQREMFKELLSLLKEISANSEVNSMFPTNLCTCPLTPILLKNIRFTLETQSYATDNNLGKFLIENADQILTEM
ncbi:MAG: hypothetical protein JSR93_11415 [Verrucomicrobia bacterium]|nr:hypothetical protein [Verrucomicrobiota bacterium]